MVRYFSLPGKEGDAQNFTIRAYKIMIYVRIIVLKIMGYVAI